MAVFSRIVLAACVVSSALFVGASIPHAIDGRQVTARQLKNSQPRAHHAHVAHAHSARTHKKRSADKSSVCAAKKSANAVTSSALTTTTTTVQAQDTTTPQPAQNTPPPAPAPPQNGGKAGLAWNDGNQPYMKNLLTTGKVTWTYTWSPWSPGDDCEFVPMLWSDKQIGDWNNNIAGKSFDAVLAFNEPEQPGQSAMSVSHAIDLWYQYIKPMNARHGSPAVTSSPAGLDWLQDFMNSCGDSCQVDFVCVHHYGTDSGVFIQMVKDLCSKYGKPVWVTEWACQNYGSDPQNQCSLSDIQKFMAETQGFLDGYACVERYAWFGPLTQFPAGFNELNRLITPSGDITALGQQYIAW